MMNRKTKPPEGGFVFGKPEKNPECTPLVGLMVL
jgi:hypothetical protein